MYEEKEIDEEKEERRVRNFKDFLKSKLFLLGSQNLDYS